MNRHVLLTLVFLPILIIACSSHRDDDAKTHAASSDRPHPFTVRATDSSVIATYEWADTMEVFSFLLLVRGPDGIYRTQGTLDHHDLNPLLTGQDYELRFADFGVDALPDSCNLLFLDQSGLESDVQYGWRFVDGKFEPRVHEFGGE